MPEGARPPRADVFAPLVQLPREPRLDPVLFEGPIVPLADERPPTLEQVLQLLPPRLDGLHSARQ